MADLIQIEVGELTASAEDRTVSGLLLPYGEIGHTNVGKVKINRETVANGRLKIPRDPSAIYAKIDHQPVTQPAVGHGTKIEDTPQGIAATFSIANTDEGDKLLAEEIPQGSRNMLSVEIANPIIRDGEILGGTLSAAAFVPRGAFPSANLFAADCGDAENVLPQTPAASATPETPAPETPGEPASTTKEDALAPTAPIETAPVAQPEAPAVQAAAAPAAPVEAAPAPTPVLASLGSGVPASVQIAPVVAAPTYSEMLSLLAAKFNGHATPDQAARLRENLTSPEQLFAAWGNVPSSGTGAVVNQPTQWVGELLAHATYQPAIADLIAHEDLTSRNIQGYQITTEPTGGDWNGNGSAPTSTGMKGTTKNYTANLFSGADGISREFFDFGASEQTLSTYFRFQTNNYLKWRDQKVFAAINSVAGSIVADNPAAFASGIGTGWSALVDGIVQVVVNQGGIPTFAVVEPSLWKSMLKVTNQQVIAYLASALNSNRGDAENILQQFTYRPDTSGTLAAGNILVGNGQAGATLYELPGSPLRAQVQNVQIGTVDVGLFGYAAAVPEGAAWFTKVTPYVGS